MISLLRKGVDIFLYEINVTEVFAITFIFRININLLDLRIYNLHCIGGIQNKRIVRSTYAEEYLGQGAAVLEAELSQKNVGKGAVKPGVLDAV